MARRLGFGGAALPDTTCDQIDVLTELWNEVPYMKGAFFYRAVEAQIGRALVDQAIADFYREHRGRAARMQDMIDTIAEVSGFNPKPLADGWLRSLGRPDK
jgi:aminopeptidase N